jgi:uncharacterized membrane protein
MNRYMMAGLSALAGAVVLEAALVPALAIGGAAILVPALLPRLRRGLQPALDAIARPPAAEPPAAPPDQSDDAEAPALPLPDKLAVKQALAKTVTFRVIVTSLDFTSNYIVLGEFATAAGLSSFSLVAGPIFYFVHETTWNYLGPPSGTTVELKPLPRNTQTPSRGGWSHITISRALAKTITFRTIATVMDFTTNFVVIGDVATAAGLSAFGFVLGPFVYLGHEAVWDRFARATNTLDVTPIAEHASDPGSALQGAS